MRLLSVREFCPGEVTAVVIGVVEARLRLVERAASYWGSPRRTSTCTWSRWRRMSLAGAGAS